MTLAARPVRHLGIRCCLLLAALLTATGAAAETIQLSITTQVTARARHASIDLALRNDGDAPAVSLTPVLTLRGIDTPGTFVPLLEPSSTVHQTVTIEMPEGDNPGGVWPLFVRVAYLDGELHPFEALHVTTVAFGDGLPAPGVTLRLSGARVETTGEVLAEVAGPARTRVALTFVTTAGVAITPQDATVTLDATARRIAAIVTNAGATPASRLPVFAVAEYEAGGGHETVVAVAFVEIAGDGAGTSRTLLLAGLIVLLVVWGIVAFAGQRSEHG